MENREGYFKTEDGLNLFYRHYFKPQAKYTFLILHGHAEHTGRYEKFVSFLNDHPVSVAIYDMRGYGRSEGREVYVDDYSSFIRDVSAFHDFLMIDSRTQRPVILFGHSMGGLISLYWLRTRKAQIKGAILSSPCLGLLLPQFLVKFNQTMNKLWPRFVYKNSIYPPHLTHNPEEIEYYKKDPLIRRKISARLLAQLHKYCEGFHAGNLEKFDFPFYVLMSGLEKVVDKNKTRHVFDQIQAPEKELFCFDNFYHEIFNELEQEKAFDCLDQVLGRIYSFNNI